MYCSSGNEAHVGVSTVNEIYETEPGVLLMPISVFVHSDSVS